MATHQVRLFRAIRVDGETRVEEEPGFAVDAFTIPAARRAVVARLRSMGKTMRSLSPLRGGGFAAVTTGTFVAEVPPTGGGTTGGGTGGGRDGYGGGTYGGGSFGG